MKYFKGKIAQFFAPLPIIISLLIFINHLACTLLYLAPINPATRYYGDYVRSYINPFFTQRWLLFAPEPQTSQVRIWYKCKIMDRWTNWSDPSYEIIEKHQTNRFGYYGKASFVFLGISRDLHNLNLSNPNSNTIEKSYEYENAKKAVSALCLKEDSNATSIQFSLVNLRVKNFSERANPGYYGKVLRINFPETNI